MGRPALDPAFKRERLTAARLKAQRLNRQLPPNVYAFATPSGNVYIRFEPPTGPKIILRQPFPSIAFDEELLALRRGDRGSVQPRPRLTSNKVEDGPAHGTWRWLCEAYYASADFKGYTLRDQRVRRGVLERTCEAPLNPDDPTPFGKVPLEQFKTKAVLVLKARFARYEIVKDEMYPDDLNSVRTLATTPEAANSVVRYIRLVFEWALTAHTDLIGGRNWAREVKLFAPGKGHRTWGPEQCAAFETTHKQGTLMRLVYDIAYYTGQRLGDVARMGQHMVEQKGSRTQIKFVQAKGRRKDPVTAFVPMFPELKRAFDVAERNGLLGSKTFISQSNGRGYSAASLGNMFREACKQAGLIGFSMHGLRKTGVVNLIRANCSFWQIMAITGHRSKKEIERYGREYMREMASEEAFEKWLNRQRNEDEREHLLVAA